MLATARSLATDRSLATARSLATDRTAVTGPRRLSVPRQTTVDAGDDGCPLMVDGSTIDAVRESWLIEDRWWTDRPLRRRYWELVTTCGRNMVVFHDLEQGRWWRQR